MFRGTIFIGCFKFVVCNTQQNRICSILLPVASNTFAYHILRVKCSELLCAQHVVQHVVQHVAQHVAQHVEPNFAPCEGTLTYRIMSDKQVEYKAGFGTKPHS